MKHKRYPQIRFKGFNDDWEKRKLNEISDVRDGTHDSPKYINEGHPFITSKNVKNGYINYDDIQYISDSDFNEINKRSKVDKNDILFGMIGTIGNIALIRENANFAIKNVALIKDKNIVYYLYLYHYLQSQNILKQFDENKDGGTQQFIALNKIRDLNIVLPSKPEQEIIGNFLEKLDNLINLHQNKHDKLTEIKNSLLEKMFPKNNEKIPEIRFKGFHSDWRQYKLDDFGKSTGGVSIESEFTNDGEYKVISIGSYSEMSTYNDQGIRCKLSNRTKDKVLNKDDITMILNDKTSSGNIIGRVLLIDKSGEYVYNQRTERIEINKKEYDPMFIYQLLNAPNIRKKIINESQGNTQIYVNWTKIKELLYYVPDIKEQEKLGIYFKNIDNLIILYQNKLKKLKKLKETLLRKMFI